MKSNKEKSKSTFRKINDWLHLWLGLVSGIVVFIVSITGCFYAFQQEIKDALEPWRFVSIQDKSFVPPSALLKEANAHMPGKEPTGLTYSNEEGAAAVGYSDFENGKRSFSVVFLNPYSGEFIRKEQTLGGDQFDFFRFVINGHRALWLPYNIGRPIVGVCTLIFVFLLISGLIMWWPKKWNKANKKKSFSIKWNGSFRRVNYDLHNVLGFYSLLLAFVIALTGLVWSFHWVEDGLYYLTSGGQEKPGHHHPHSDVNMAELVEIDSIAALDKAWYLTLEHEPDVQGMYMTPILKDDDDAIEIIAYQDNGSFYDHNSYFYDRYTLKPLRMQGDRFNEASFADQLSMMNYDIHIGAILGFAGKLLAFLLSLICASLPITGLLIWLNKKKKSSNNANGKSVNKSKVKMAKPKITLVNS